MKATTILLAAVLSIQISVLFAGNKETTPTENTESASLNINQLAPVTPEEATFEEGIETVVSAFDFSRLAPVTPEEAGFTDIVPEKNIDLTILAPVTPAEAEFNDNSEELSAGLRSLEPVTPAEADFE